MVMLFAVSVQRVACWL